MAISPISIRLDEITKARLERSAKAQDRSLSYVAQKAILSYLDTQELKHKAIVEALAEFEHETHLVSGEAVSAWVESWDSEAELPMPGPDVIRSR